MRTRAGQKGVAMATAIVLALIVSVLVAGVLSLTMRRFELSAFRTDHAVAAVTSEAGFQYAFARLAADDAVFGVAVRAKRNALGAGAIAAGDQRAEYVVSCHDKPEQVPPDLDDDREDLLVPEIHMGNKHVRIRIRFFNQADIDAGFYPAALAARPYRVRSFSYFGTGEEWK